MSFVDFALSDIGKRRLTTSMDESADCDRFQEDEDHGDFTDPTSIDSVKAPIGNVPVTFSMIFGY